MIKINCWRITKYNPIYRDEKGNFTQDDWTSVHDIGKSFVNGELTVESYLYYENAYIDAIKVMMKHNNVNYFKTEGLEKNGYIDIQNLSEADTKQFYNFVKNGYVVTLDNIRPIAQLILREIIWCKLVSNTMFVNFGYDFYMYIGGCDLSKMEQKIIEGNGLFIEEMDSPYL